MKTPVFIPQEENFLFLIGDGHLNGLRKGNSSVLYLSYSDFSAGIVELLPVWDVFIRHNGGSLPEKTRDIFNKINIHSVNSHHIEENVPITLSDNIGEYDYDSGSGLVKEVKISFGDFTKGVFDFLGKNSNLYIKIDNEDSKAEFMAIWEKLFLEKKKENTEENHIAV